MTDEILQELKLVREALFRLAEHMDAPLPLVLTKAEAAKQLSVSVTTLMALVKERKLRTVRIGRRWMIPALQLIHMATPVERPGSPSRQLRSKGRAQAFAEAEKVRAALRRR